VGPAETTALVIAIVAVIEGLMSLVKHLINRGDKNEQDVKIEKILNGVLSTKEKVFHLYDMHSRFDSDGTPMWYVPRSWAESQDKLAEKIQMISQTQLQVLGIIERLERRIEHDDHDNRR